MGVPRMIQSQFGALTYDSGVITPSLSTPLTPTALFNDVFTANYQQVKRHNDVFHEPVAGSNLTTDGLSFMTYQYVDLRDLLEEKACMDDVVINVQRMYELPYPAISYNIPPGNIEETLLVLLGDYDLDTPGLFDIKKAAHAGFGPLKDPTTDDSQGGLPFEVLYREVRQYVQDPSQNFVSPGQIGTQAGPTGNAAITPTRFVGNWRMASRTIGGYPDLLVGPGITIIRAFTVFPASRQIQSIDGAGPTDQPADEFAFLQMRLQLGIPALQLNIVGTQRPLTATETATYYSNILMKS